MTATNSIGLSASTPVTVIVDDQLEIPGPTLSVGPGQVVWSVANGSRRLQITRLSISNTGAGPLEWSASSEASWLRLSHNQGEAPATLTLSVDPSDLPADTALSTEVLVTGPDGQITIPVSLVLGDPQAPTEESVLFRRGDANGDGVVDISDGSYTLNWLFLGREDPPCLEGTNANGNSGTDIADASYLLNFLFLGGSAPPAPFPRCGIDSDSVELNCDRYDACR